MGRAAPPKPRKITAFLDTAASTTCMGEEAACDVAKTQLPNVKLDTPSNVPIKSRRTLEMRMKKLPQAARTAYEVLGLPHNIISGAELVDAGCTLHLDKYMAEIELEGETLYKDFQDRPTRL